MLRSHVPVILTASTMLAFSTPSSAQEESARGAQAARACMACHSFTPGRHMTGPSLANVWFIEEFRGRLRGF